MPTATARLGGAAWRDWAALGPARRISSQRWYFPHRPSRRRPRGPRQAAASSWTGAWFVLMYFFVSSKEGADFLSGRCTFPKSNSEERIPARNTCVCPNNKIETEISGRKRASRSTGKCLWSPFLYQFTPSERSCLGPSFLFVCVHASLQRRHILAPLQQTQFSFADRRIDDTCIVQWSYNSR